MKKFGQFLANQRYEGLIHETAVLMAEAGVTEPWEFFLQFHKGDRRMETAILEKINERQHLAESVMNEAGFWNGIKNIFDPMGAQGRAQDDQNNTQAKQYTQQQQQSLQSRNANVIKGQQIVTALGNALTQYQTLLTSGVFGNFNNNQDAKNFYQHLQHMQTILQHQLKQMQDASNTGDINLGPGTGDINLGLGTSTTTPGTPAPGTNPPPGSPPPGGGNNTNFQQMQSLINNLKTVATDPAKASNYWKRIQGKITDPNALRFIAQQAGYKPGP